MASTRFSMKDEGFDEIYERISQAGSGVEKIVNTVLHDYGGARIEEGIQSLLPSSGRKWKKKKAAAKTTQPFRQTDENLAVTVRSKPNYNYLYFPDDGSNTRRHAGQQHFMRRGLEDATDDILLRITAKVAEKIGG